MAPQGRSRLPKSVLPVPLGPIGVPLESHWSPIGCRVRDDGVSLVTVAPQSRPLHHSRP